MDAQLGEYGTHLLFLMGLAVLLAGAGCDIARSVADKSWHQDYDNAYAGWFNDLGNTITGAGNPRTATGANGGVVEGTVDLAAYLTSVPQQLAIAAAPYGSANATFCPMGDVYGRLIVVDAQRSWYPDHGVLAAQTPCHISMRSTLPHTVQLTFTTPQELPHRT